MWNWNKGVTIFPEIPQLQPGKQKVKLVELALCNSNHLVFILWIRRAAGISSRFFFFSFVPPPLQYAPISDETPFSFSIFQPLPSLDLSLFCMLLMLL